MQVTSDGVPVIFHDDYVVSGSLVAPKRKLISEMTVEQFKSMGPLLRRSKCAETRRVQPYDNIWQCEEEDTMPELVDVLHKLPQVWSSMLSTVSARCDASVWADRNGT